MKLKNPEKEVSQKVVEEDTENIVSSIQLEAEKAKNKQLEGRIRLYEKGITDKSLHASQTNIGLLTIANEDNSSGVTAHHNPCGECLKS